MKLRAARALFFVLLNDSEGHTAKVNKDRQLLLMLKLHYIRYTNSVVIIGPPPPMTNRVNPITDRGSDQP